MNLILLCLAVAVLGILALFVRFKPSGLALTALAHLNDLASIAESDVNRAIAVVQSHTEAIAELVKKKVAAEQELAHKKLIANRLSGLAAAPLAISESQVRRSPVLPSRTDVATAVVPRATIRTPVLDAALITAAAPPAVDNPDAALRKLMSTNL